MPITTADIVPLNKVRASLTALTEEARAGREKIITKNGEGYVALIDARQLDYYHRLERERAYNTIAEDVMRGLDDMQAGRTITAATFRKKHAARIRK
jgi:antitoxin (DNA-binding transcriptional repressor) of toxin-antitoxin stability system